MKKLKNLICTVLCLLMAVTSLPMVSAADVNYKTLPLDDNWQTGTITESNTEDFYKFTLTSDGEVTLKVMHYMSCYFDIYNEDFSQTIRDGRLYDGSSSSPTTDSFSYSLSKGSYYIKISKRDTGNYKLRGTFISYGCNEKEPNDFDSASNLSQGTTVKGCLTQTNSSEDWYKIYVPTNCSVTFKIKHYMACYFDVYNYDVSETIRDGRLYSGSSTSPYTDALTYDLSSGYYYIKVSVRDYGKYELSWSMNINVEIPTNLYVTSNSTTAVKLKWDRVTAEGYQLQQKINGKWTNITTTNKTNYTISKLRPAVKHIFRVRAYKTYQNKKYYSKWSNTITTCTNPDKVTLNTVKSTGYGSFTAKWKQVNGNGYQVQYSKYKDFSYYNYYTVSGKSNTSKTVTWLYSKQKYYVRVRAYRTIANTTYYGKYSNVKAVKTK